MDIKREVTKTIKMTVTLPEHLYKKALREAAGAPVHAEVDIEDTYGGDITVTWTEVSHVDDAGSND